MEALWVLVSATSTRRSGDGGIGGRSPNGCVIVGGVTLGLNGRWATMTTDTIIETTTPSSTRVTPPLIQLPTELSARQPTSLTGDDAARICTAITAAHTSSTRAGYGHGSK